MANTKINLKWTHNFRVTGNAEVINEILSIIIIEKKNRCQIIDFAIPEDGRVREEVQDEKFEKYLDL